MSLDALDFRPGTRLAAADLQAILSELRRPTTGIRGGPGIDARRGSDGQVQLAYVPSRGFVCVASGNISARSSSTWGTGTVTLYSFDGINDYSLSIDIDVVNPSSNTMTDGHGIDSGQYCWVDRSEQGWWVVSPMECA